MTNNQTAKIEARNLWKLYGDDPAGFLAKHGGHPDPEALSDAGYIPAVRNVSIDIHIGEILVIMGLSGSGKSTLLRCLTRLIEPTAGQVHLDGLNLLEASDKELINIRRHKMGMVFQHFALFPHRTVARNVAFPLEVQGIGVAERLDKAEELLSLVGLAGRGEFYPRELSGGQQQRVGIARSLAVEPEIWFLDEPFSALDPLIRREMQDEFLRLQDLLHTTIVFITHDFDEAIRLADRIAIMYEGEIVQLDTPSAIITEPANDYVAAFTRNVTRERVLTVAHIMGEVDASTSGSVSAGSSLADVAEQVLSSDLPVSVSNGDGAVIGSITRAQLIAALFPEGE